jgi:hypothetical protein
MRRGRFAPNITKLPELLRQPWTREAEEDLGRHKR